MKEFITQRELADEFIGFLTDKELLDKYREMLCERIDDSYPDEPHVLLFNESDTIEEYIQKVNDGKPILDIDIALMTADIKTKRYPSLKNIQDILRISNNFEHFFRCKYEKEIAAMLENGKKLLIRFLKSNEMKFTIERLVNDMDALSAIMTPKTLLYKNVPSTIFSPMFNKVSNQGEFDIVMDVKSDFIKYYIEHMERQKE